MTPAELKKLRRNAGLSQTDLADKLGMSLRSVQDLESGATPIREVHRLALTGLGIGAEVDIATLAARHVVRWEKQIEIAERTLDRIDNHGMTFHEASGDEPMRDVTVERRAEVVANIDAYKEARSRWASVLSQTEA